MTARFPEEYYRKHWDEFLRPQGNDPDYINLEGRLAKEMAVYEQAGIGGEALEKIRCTKAGELAEYCTALVREQMRVEKMLEAGETSMGFTTERDERDARRDHRTRFEFNCLQLRDFKEKYGL